MGKVLALLVFILLAFASVAGYIFLTGKITAGERQITEGQGKFKKGQTALKEGKAKLEAGKRDLSEGRKEYENAKDGWFLEFADKLLKGGKGFKEAEKKIAEGDKRVAKGEDKVNVEERRLDIGELELSQGMELLRLAKGARVACAVGAVFFTALSILLGFWWRRSLFRLIRH